MKKEKKLTVKHYVQPSRTLYSIEISSKSVYKFLEPIVGFTDPLYMRIIYDRKVTRIPSITEKTSALFASVVLNDRSIDPEELRTHLIENDLRILYCIKQYYDTHGLDFSVYELVAESGVYKDPVNWLIKEQIQLIGRNLNLATQLVLKKMRKPLLADNLMLAFDKNIFPTWKLLGEIDPNIISALIEEYGSTVLAFSVLTELFTKKRTLLYRIDLETDSPAISVLDSFYTQNEFRIGIHNQPKIDKIPFTELLNNIRTSETKHWELTNAKLQNNS